MIDDIYNKQLEIILSSVNSYSQDWTSSWATKINNYFISERTDPEASLQQFIQSNPSILGIFYTQDSAFQNIEMIAPRYSLTTFTQKRAIKKLLRDNSRKINKLYVYFKNGGYRKIEAFSSSATPNVSYFMFFADNYKGDKLLCGMVVDAREFANQVLSPKIQALIEGQFIISIRNEEKNRTIYISERGSTEKMSQVKPLWLLPEYKIGIIYKGKTIKQLVRDRTFLNIILILLLDALLVAGVIFVLRSLKTEMNLSQMRADFISNVSHELRTPLALMSVYSETILLGRIKGDKLTEYHQTIHQETIRLTSIVSKILNFSRIEEKKFKYQFDKVNLNEIVDNVMERFEFHLKSQNFIFEKKIKPDILPIFADREALMEVFMNLVDNAIKYSKDDKYLCIETWSEHDTVYAEISDKGIGIPENEQKYVFDKFFRVTDGEMQGARGSGLGLSIVKNIIDTHLAKITIHSKLGAGSVFRLEFPAYGVQQIKKLKKNH